MPCSCARATGASLGRALSSRRGSGPSSASPSISRWELPERLWMLSRQPRRTGPGGAEGLEQRRGSARWTVPDWSFCRATQPQQAWPCCGMGARGRRQARPGSGGATGGEARPPLGKSRAGWRERLPSEGPPVRAPHLLSSHPRRRRLPRPRAGRAEPWRQWRPGAPPRRGRSAI